MWASRKLVTSFPFPPFLPPAENAAKTMCFSTGSPTSGVVKADALPHHTPPAGTTHQPSPAPHTRGPWTNDATLIRGHAGLQAGSGSSQADLVCRCDGNKKWARDIYTLILVSLSLCRQIRGDECNRLYNSRHHGMALLVETQRNRFKKISRFKNSSRMIKDFRLFCLPGP